MLDTNICIYAMNRRRGFRARLPLEDCGVSIVVLGELELGAHRSSRSAQSFAAIRDFAASVQVLDLDVEAARRYGRVRAHLHAIGRPDSLFPAGAKYGQHAPRGPAQGDTGREERQIDRQHDPVIQRGRHPGPRAGRQTVRHGHAQTAQGRQHRQQPRARGGG